MSRLPLCALLAAIAAAAAAQDDAAPQPSLPPEPRPLMLAPDASAARPRAADTAARAAVADDLAGLQRALERVRAVLAANGSPLPEPATAAAPAAEDKPAADAQREPDGAARASTLFKLSVQRWTDGSITVTADVRQERLERVYRELARLIGRPLDDSRLMGSHGLASLAVADLAWTDAFDRLLGQAGLWWREEGSGATAKLVVLDPAVDRPESARLEQLATSALADAARIDGPIGIEAVYLMGEQEARAGRRYEAMRDFHRLVQLHGSSADARARPWVLKALRGIGDQMAALGRHQDARAVYGEWLARAPADDEQLATIYLASADQALALAREKDEPGAAEDAIDLLHAMLERCAGEPRFAAETARARLTLGELLITAGRHREAAVQLTRFAEAAGRVDDQVAFWRAECDFVGDAAQQALPVYERLAGRRRHGEKDATAPDEVYATAAYRIGQCHLAAQPPRHVHALFAFLRAHQDWPESKLQAEVLVNIARCYAEIEREDDSIAALMDLLQTDAAVDPRPGRLQVDQLLGDLEGRIAAYPGPVRARVLFHIAQANWREAVRERGDRERLVGEAVQRYERVIAEGAPPELAAAARLGLARVAFLGGRDADGERAIHELLADHALSGRDRDLAAQLLGNHYRDKGRLRDAIAAYAGELR